MTKSVVLTRAHLLVATAVAAACATTTSSVPIQYSFTDAPDRGGIALAWRNTSGRAMCLESNHWPNAAGKLHFSGDSVFLVVEGRSFPIEDWNGGYCIPSCRTRVRAGEEINAFIRYEDFSLPAELAGKPKTLIFSPQAYACSRSE